MNELYKIHRPRKFLDVVGQDDVCKMLRNMIKNKNLPHTLLFTGPSGVGKSTLAHILRHKIKCDDLDFRKINSADNRGIDTVREIRQNMNNAAWRKGGCRVFLLEEVHQMNKNAQDAFLDILEFTPKHVYFFLCTTDPEKLQKPFWTRCTEIRLCPISVEDLENLVSKVAEKEEGKISETIISRIAEISDGSARKALVYLHQCLELSTEKERLDLLLKADRNTIDEILKTFFRKGSRWSDVAKLLRIVEDEDVEGIRFRILGYASKILLSGKTDAVAHLIITAFEDNFYDGKKHSLIRACYDVMQNRK